MSYPNFQFVAGRLLVALLCMSFSSYGNVRLPAVLASNMVLQQRSEVKLWGWGEPNEKVVVTTSWDNKTYPAVTVTGFADWQLTVQTPAAGGPYTIHIDGNNKIVLTNVMIGEVWICGGQSNMEMCGNWGLQDVKAEYAKAHLTGLRLFHVAKAAAAEPQRDCVGSWEACDSVSLPSFSAVAYFFGKRLQETLHVPVGLVESCWSGSSAEVWTPDSLIESDDVLREAAKKILANGQVPHLPGYAYNAMIAPLTNFSLAGVIWYQGENNTMSAGTYPRLFTTMIDSWRKAWGKDLPFYYVQVAPFRYQLADVGALMREAQTRCLEHANTGMVVTTDLVTDVSNVHPSDKHDVGGRLANWALAETYHQTGLVYRSPLFSRCVIDKDKAIVYVDHPGGGLVVRRKGVPELYIAGEDKVFHPAQAVVEKDRLIVRSPDVPHPVAVRYAFSNAAIGNVFSREGLPLGPFRTDDWPVGNELAAQRPELPVITGKFVHIFDPNETRSSEDTTWYTNDHSFIRGKDGIWHAYGIIGHHPIRPWGGETKFFHITAKSLRQEKWEDHGYALTAKEGMERVLWAPYVLEDKGLFYMFYNIGNMQRDAPNYASWGQLCMATSKDLNSWERHPLNPLFSDPGHARDSYVMKYNGNYYYYYTRTYNEVDHRSVVAVRKGPDLTHWSGPKIIHVEPYEVNWGGDAESPFVVHRKGIFYLFICRAMTNYNQTDVYWSTDPENFPKDQLVCTLPVHAAEVIHDEKEGWFISNTGWDKKGLYLAPLEWKDTALIAHQRDSSRLPALNHDFPDPTVIRVGGKYYGYATNSMVNGKYAHIQLASSDDMVHWKDEGDALPAGAVWASRDFWAPHVIYDPKQKKYVLFFSAESKVDSTGKCIGVAFSDSPEGPFVDMGQPLISGKDFEDIDPCAIIDPKSGKKLLYWGSGFHPIQVQELSDDWKSFKRGSHPKAVMYPKQEGRYDNLIEGTWIDYANGYYYMYYSGDNCCGQSANYAVMVARSKDPFGPFQRLGQANGSGSSVILEKNSEWTAPGHNSIFRDEKGRVYIAYHAVATGVSMKPAGRVLMISPVVYEKGWPVVKY